MRRAFVIISVVAAVVFLTVGMMSSSASALTWNYSGGKLLGASGVNVLGTSYDVEFKDGSCISLFGGCDASSDFTFQTETDATAAANALLDQVLLDIIDGAPANFDSHPELTNGISDTEIGRIYIPFAGYLDGMIYRFDAVRASNLWSSASIDDYVASAFGAYSVNDTSEIPHETFAVWTASPIPEPSTLLLLLSGFVGLGVLHRKIKQR